jgi:F-type H+-transporting ATPase subunit a
MQSEIYETPNFLYLFYQRHLDKAWGMFLQRWENIFFSLLIASLLALVFYLGARKRALIPSGLQNVLELVVETIQKLINEILGPEGDKYLPFLGTLFIYILTMNWWGLIPLMKTPSSNLSITAAFAICVFCYVQYLNIKNMGFFGFLYHLAGSPKNAVGWCITPLILPLELLTQVARPVTLALRLCGNMLGEHILIAVFALMGLIWLATIAFPLAIPIQVPIVFLALLTGFMQALVFTVLSAVYILLSIPHEH